MIDTAISSYRRKRWVMAGSGVVADDAAGMEGRGEELARLAQALKVPRIVAQLLINRGFREASAAAAFLEPKFKDLHAPWLMPNMEAAAERIVQAVRAKQKIVLYGDYDVDGITGTTMLWHTLKTAGADVDYYIPHRVDEGYGLNVEAVQGLIGKGVQLLITVDCGCAAVAPITAARQAGVDVVISDHHEFAPTLPPANALVHPRAPWAEGAEHAAYPNPDLCGAGVAFKLAWAVAQRLCHAERVNQTYRDLLLEFSALAALGTIADVVPLTGENRILVTYGLMQLGRTRFEGLRALIHAAGYGEGQRKLDCMAVGFALAPRLNAAGRMDHAREAVELLTTATGPRAEEIATSLESQNRQRQAAERRMVGIAREQIEQRNAGIESPDHVLVVAHESFHVGVVGIVASRLVDLYYRPTFVLARHAEELHGSARSVNGFELHLAIEHVRDLLTSGGGHAMAGGVRLAAARLEAFRDRLNAFARERLSDEQLVPTLNIEGVLALADCHPRVISQIERLEPFGRGNPKPRFLVEGVRLTAPPRRVGSTGTHLQLTVARPPHVARCIAFGMGELEPQLPVGTDLHLIAEPRVEVYNGSSRVDLVVVDVARADEAPFERIQ